MTPQRGAKPRPPASPLIGEYLQALRRRNLSPTSLTQYREILTPYVRSVDPLDAATEDIELWLDRLTVGPRARCAYASCIAGFHRWLLDAGRVSVDAGARLSRPKLPRTLPRPIASHDLAKALEHATLRMRAWLSLAAFQGLRCKEIAGLRVEDLALDSDPPMLNLVITKGSKARSLPLADEVLEAMAAYGTPRAGPVFPSLGPTGERTSQPMSPRHVSQTINGYLRGLDIAATAHQLRHWFGTSVYGATRDIQLTAALMGHSSLNTTQGYVALVPDAAAIAAVRALKV